MFFFRLITLLSFTLKLPPERAEALIMKPLLFWYLGKNRKKTNLSTFTLNRTLIKPHSLGPFFLFCFCFFINRKNREALVFFLTVFYSQGCSAFKASSSRSCVFSRQRSLIFVSFIDASFFAIFLLVTFQYKKLYKKKPHNKPNFILCGWCVGNKFKKVTIGC